MAGNDLFEIEKPFAGKGRHFRVHGESVANGNKAYVRLIDLLNQRHIAKYIRIPHMIEAWLPVCPQDDAVGIAQAMADTILI